MGGQCSRFPASSRRDQMTKQKHQVVKDHESGTVSTWYCTIIHLWVKTYETFSSLNQGGFFFFFSVLIVRVWAQFRWVFSSDSHKVAIKGMCQLCHLEVWLKWHVLPSPFRRLAEFIALQLYDWGSWPLSGCWLEATLVFLPYGPFHKHFPVLICFLRPPE